MIYITEEERQTILNNHKSLNESTLCFWYNKITSRLDYLSPLFTELNEKGLKLETVSESLNKEVFEITNLKSILQQYKKYNYSCECGLKTNDYLEWKKCDCNSIP